MLFPLSTRGHQLVTYLYLVEYKEKETHYFKYLIVCTVEIWMENFLFDQTPALRSAPDTIYCNINDKDPSTPPHSPTTPPHSPTTPPDSPTTPPSERTFWSATSPNLSGQHRTVCTLYCTPVYIYTVLLAAWLPE
jgi:hypothetical protein